LAARGIAVDICGVSIHAISIADAADCDHSGQRIIGLIDARAGQDDIIFATNYGSTARRTDVNKKNERRHEAHPDPL
jgi:hypothetical protein